jgi:NTE family protein
MLFHVGALWRLNEAGLLPKLDRISSVSGGSIASAFLGLKWNELSFDERGVSGVFAKAVVEPIRRFALLNVDVPAIIKGVFLPGCIGRNVMIAYRKHLYGHATLNALPDKPRFIINATNVQTGALWRFSKPYMADWRVGRADRPDVPLAMAVAASSAFPPFLSPVILGLKKYRMQLTEGADLHKPPYIDRAILSDGGVYDNLGLETAWKNCATLFVSDGGAPFVPEPSPWRNWLMHSIRVADLIDHQVRSLRKRDLIDSYQSKDQDRKRTGAYWGIDTDIEKYGLPDALPCPAAEIHKLAAYPTRLTRVPDEVQEKLINWGYAVCDADLRGRYDPGIAKPHGFPYSRGFG